MPPVGRVGAEHGHPAAVAAQVALEDLDGRRLSRPVGTEHGDHFAFVDTEVDAAHRLDGAVCLGEALDLDGVHRSSLAPRTDGIGVARVVTMVTARPGPARPGSWAGRPGVPSSSSDRFQLPHHLVPLHRQRGPLGDGRRRPGRLRPADRGRDRRHPDRSRDSRPASAPAPPSRRSAWSCPTIAAARSGPTIWTTPPWSSPWPPSTSSGSAASIPSASPRTGTLRRLARDLPVAGPLDQRVAALDLAEVELGRWEEVTDPAGGEVAEFTACAQEIVQLVADLAGAWRVPG